MFEFMKKWLGETKQDKDVHSNVEREFSIDEVKRAISQFSHEKPHGVPLRVLVGEHHTIDFSLLLPYLGAKPTRPFYMSRETYEVFEEEEIAIQMDDIQRAVDDYISIEGSLPILHDDPSRKVNYQKLRSYLTIEPTIETYLTMDENLISLKEPKLHLGD